MEYGHMLTAARACLLVAGMVTLPILAFDSGPEPEADEGPAEVRKVPPWGYDPAAPQSPPNEHAWLFHIAMGRSGIPLTLRVTPAAPFTAKTYSIDSPVEGGMKSITPTAFDIATVSNLRSYTLPGFASLPDHSYSLGDWASGNELCPPGTVLADNGPHECHSFTKHLGAINSTHFPPQADLNYSWYHTLALTRAKECHSLGDRFKSSSLWATNMETMVEMVRECEREALAMEAVGQHFLQDVWAIGHMWERWGYATINDFPLGVPAPGQEAAIRLLTAAITAAVAGTIHGAESLVHAPDLMSAGQDPLVTWSAAGAVGPSGPGIGDLHADKLLTDDTYFLQRISLLNCSASGIRDVYEATANFSTEPPGQALDAFTGDRVDPLSSKCLGQRANNSAMFLGLNIRCPQKALDDAATARTAKAICNNLEPSQLNDFVTVYAWSFIRAEVVKGDPRQRVPVNLVDLARIQLVRASAYAAFRAKEDPGGTDLANHAFAITEADGIEKLGAGFLGVERNGLAVRSYPPGPYAEPKLPWPGASPSADGWRPDLWLGRTFHRSHVADWCDRPETAPSQLISRIAQTSGSIRATACQVCTEFVKRHIQITDAQSTGSICNAAGSKAPPITQPSGTNISIAAAIQCKCGWDAEADLGSASGDGAWSYGYADNRFQKPYVFSPLPRTRDDRSLSYRFPAVTSEYLPYVAHNSSENEVLNVRADQSNIVVNSVLFTFRPRSLLFARARFNTIDFPIRDVGLRWNSPIKGNIHIELDIPLAPAFGKHGCYFNVGLNGRFVDGISGFSGEFSLSVDQFDALDFTIVEDNNTESSGCYANVRITPTN